MMLSDVCLSIAYIWPKSRTERPRKTKIGTEVAHVICDSDTTFKVKRSRSQVEEAYCGGLLPTACFRQVIMLCPVHSLLSACYECCQPKMIGTCSVPLKFILQADALFLDRTLEVRDRPRAAGHNSSLMQDNDWPLVGLLKVRLEPSRRMSSLFYSLVHGKQEIIKKKLLRSTCVSWHQKRTICIQLSALMSLLLSFQFPVIISLHLLRSIALLYFMCKSCISLSTTSFHVFLGHAVCLEF